MIDAGANLDVQNDEQSTALIYAVRAGDVESAKELVNAGANILIKGQNKMSALGIARKLQNDVLIDILEAAQPLSKLRWCSRC